MIISQLTGGLGNQLFQYAAALSLSKHHDVPLLLDVSSFQREELPELEIPRNFELYNFSGVSEKIISPSEINQIINYKPKFKLLFKTLPKHRRPIYTEPFYHYDPNFYKSRKTVLLKGGWQSEKYFKPIESELQQRLEIKPEYIMRVKEQALALQNSNSVGIHIRRGDYLRKKIIFEWHGVMSRDYYVQAIGQIEKLSGPLHLHYFTDDPQWVKEELLPALPGNIVSGNSTHLEDFYLMSQCRHNVIANSSFSWWAAWLNASKDKIVVGPKNWFDKGPKDTYDVLPADWIRI